MKNKILLTVLLLSLVKLCIAQDTSAIINTSWTAYASDTNLTYQQITTTCDSLFHLAGYPPAHTDDSAANSIAEGKVDGSPYMNYAQWKDFWAFRCNVATGKLHSFIADAQAMLTGGPAPANCGSTSALQSSITTVPVTPPGWQFIGPQNITAPYGEAHGDDLHQHLGEVNSIIINTANHQEIYVTDQWGGIWKTTNADPTHTSGITWTCLSDHLPFMAGIGVVNLYVDFSSSPRHLFCQLGGMPSSGALQTTEPTLGIFYSLDDGATFSQMDISAAIPDLLNNPILAMQYWPGNATSGTKYLFISTQFQVYRLDITDPTSVTSAVMVDASSIIPSDAPNSRFRGFNEITFSLADPTVMYVATNSNNGNQFSNSAGLYKISSCTTCSSCTLGGIPFAVADYLGGKGSFTNGFPTGNFQWYKSDNWNIGAGDDMICTPTTADSSLETDVDGSYFDNITYNIEYTLTLPPHTHVDVVLKDVASTVMSTYRADINAAPGIPGSTYTVGHYENNTGSPQTFDKTGGAAISVATTSFVDRLEFITHSLTGYNGTDQITLSSLKVTQPFQNYIYNLVPASAGYLYCVTGRGASDYHVQKIQDLGTPSLISTFSTATGDDAHPFFKLSTANPDVIYEWANQSSNSFTNVTLYKFNMSIGGVPTGDLHEWTALHVDGRCMFLVPNAVAPATPTDDIIYMGEDGGIGVGTFGGTWTSLNGTGMRTSWAFDIGSSIHTGEVAVAATDNDIMAGTGDFSQWAGVGNFIQDGGQAKYGKRYETRNVRFEGRSSGGGFGDLASTYLGGLPDVIPPALGGVNAPPLAKIVTTYNNEYFGTGNPGNSDGVYSDDIYDIAITSGSGTTGDPYLLGLTNLTASISYDVSDPSHYIHEPVQAIAPDPYDAKYIFAHIHSASYDQGYFAYTIDATDAPPVWTVIDNHNALPHGTGSMALICLAVDPRSAMPKKRLWAGASGYNSTPGIDRVFETNNGGTTWADISYGLPDGPVTALAYDDQSHYLFAGTDMGVYAYNVDAGTNGSGNPWVCFSLNLPNSYVTGLDVNRCTGKLYVSLYGRGAYEAELPPDANIYGTSTADGALGLSDVCDIDYVSATTTWSQDRDETRSVYVPSGVTLTISGCTISMGRDKSIIVAPGGKLVVTGATITNSCGYLWGGILAEGNPTLSQVPTTHQGYVRITSSTLANARTAISNSDQDGNKAGGIVQVDNSSFINNHRSIAFSSYHNTNSLGYMEPDLSYINSSTFTVTDDYRGDAASYPFDCMASLWDVAGVRFSGCSYTNTNTTVENRGLGINSYNAGYSVVPACGGPLISTASCLSPLRSAFSGFGTGILVDGDMSWGPTVTIDNATFNDVSIGVTVSTMNNVATTHCYFTVGNGQPVYDATYDETHLPVCYENIGIYLKNTEQFRVEEDTFTGNPSTAYQWANIGVLAQNTLSNQGLVNQIYKNNFSYLDYGCLGVGANSTHSPMGPHYGLQVLCNTFANDVADIYAGPDLTPYVNALGLVQGAPLSPAGNVFTTGGNIIAAGTGISYYCDNLAGSSAIPSGTHISVVPVSASNSCPSYLGVNNPSGLVAANPTSLPAYEAAFSISKSAYSSVLYNYSYQLDGGSTEALITTINTATDASVLYSRLMGISPYVSEFSLQALSATNLLSAGQFFNVLTANPESLRDYTFLESLTSATYNPLTMDEVNYLKTVATTSTARSATEGLISDLYTRMSLNANNIIMSMKVPVNPDTTTDTLICTDTTNVYYGVDSNRYYPYIDSVGGWLDSIARDASGTIVQPWAMYAQVGQQFFLNPSSPHIDDLMYDMSVYANSDVDRTADYNAYSTVLGVLSSLNTAHRTIYQLHPLEISTLNAISQPYSSYNGQVIANNILNQDLTKPTMLFFCFYPSGHRAAGTGAGTAVPPTGPPLSPVSNLRLNCQLSAYPNPAKDNVTFSYSVPGNTGNMVLSVTDALGQEVKHFGIRDSEGSVSWNINVMPPGVYIYMLTDDKGRVGMGKLVIAKQ